MKAISFFTVAVTALLAVSNINSAFSGNNPKVYKNVSEDKEQGTTTISMYEGVDDMNLKPVKQYVIRYATNGEPIEKIQYTWNDKKKSWQKTDKYDYIYNSDGLVDNLLHSSWDEKSNTWSDNTEFSIYLLNIDKELLTLNDDQ